MPDVMTYLGWPGTGTFDHWMSDAPTVATGLDAIIGQRGVSVTLVQRDGTARAAQTALLVLRGRETPQQRLDATGVVQEIDALLIGVRDHSHTADFVVAKGDRFAVGSAQYEVLMVEQTWPGRTVAMSRQLS